MWRLDNERLHTINQKLQEEVCAVIIMAVLWGGAGLCLGYEIGRWWK